MTHNIRPSSTSVNRDPPPHDLITLDLDENDSTKVRIDVRDLPRTKVVVYTTGETKGHEDSPVKLPGPRVRGGRTREVVFLTCGFGIVTGIRVTGWRKGGVTVGSRTTVSLIILIFGVLTVDHFSTTYRKVG